MRKLTRLATACVFMGCATSQKMNWMAMGMPKLRVLELLGEPNSTSAMEGVEYLRYFFRESNGPGDPLTPYFVRIKNGKVDAFGRLGDFDSTKDPKIEAEMKIK